MIRFYKTPWITRARYPELTWQLKSDQAIHLTFDDGPHPEVTPWVIDQLDKVKAKATFFCLGKNLKRHPGIAKEILEAGHAIGNHTQNHLNGWRTFNRDYLDDVRACDDQLMELGVHNQLFRPPYGRITKTQLRGLTNRKIIMWSHLSWDFHSKLNTKTSLRKLKTAEPGSILLFHDSPKAFDNLKILLPEVLSHYKAKGFKFETVK